MTPLAVVVTVVLIGQLVVALALVKHVRRLVEVKDIAIQQLVAAVQSLLDSSEATTVAMATAMRDITVATKEMRTHHEQLAKDVLGHHEQLTQTVSERLAERPTQVIRAMHGPYGPVK